METDSTVFRKPTARTFGICLAVVWAILCGIFWSSGAPFLAGIAVANLCIAAFNILGIVFSTTTGWYPWRD